MKRADLTRYQQVRLSKARTCPICGKEIYNDDELIFTVRPLGKSKIYIFYHAVCKEGEKENGKEIKASEEERKFSETPEYSIFLKLWKEIITEEKAFRNCCGAES